MSDIGPGDWLISLRNWPEVPAMRAGSVWCVASVHHQSRFAYCISCGNRPGDEPSGLVFVDDPAPPGTGLPSGVRSGGWCPCAFRPYHGPEQANREVSAPADRVAESVG